MSLRLTDTLSARVQHLLRLGDPISNDEVEDDHEAEKEASSPASWSAIESPDGQDDDTPASPDGLAVGWCTALAEASRGVKDSTHLEYMRYE